MKGRIEVSINYVNNDIKWAINYILNKVRKLWIVLASIIIIDVGIFIYGINIGFNKHNQTLAEGFILFSLLLYFLYYQRFIKGYVDFYSKRKGGKYVFSEENVQIIGDGIESKVQWSMYKKAYNIPKDFILMDENKFLYIFPKRCFENEHDIIFLDKLCDEKISNYKKY